MTLKIPVVQMITHDLANLVCEHLPEGYEISIVLERGCGSVHMSHIEKQVDYPYDETDDTQLTFDERVMLCLNTARKQDGLPPVQAPVTLTAPAARKDPNHVMPDGIETEKWFEYWTKNNSYLAIVETDIANGCDPVLAMKKACVELSTHLSQLRSVQMALAESIGIVVKKPSDPSKAKTRQEYVKALAPANREKLLEALLAHYIDSMGNDSDIQFHPYEEESDWLASIYCAHSGEDLIKDPVPNYTVDFDEKPVRTVGGLLSLLACSEPEEPLPIIDARGKRYEINTATSSGGGRVTILHIDEKV